MLRAIIMLEISSSTVPSGSIVIFAAPITIMKTSDATVRHMNTFSTHDDFSPRKTEAMIFTSIGTTANIIDPSTEVECDRPTTCSAMKPT